MEIKPITVNIRLTDYLEVTEHKTVDVNHSDMTYSKLIHSMKVLIFDGEGAREVILIGYYKLTKGITCVVRDIQGDCTPMLVSIYKVRVTKEVVLKEQLKDVKTVEQLNLFK